MPRLCRYEIDVKWWAEFRARRDELQAAVNDRIRAKPLRGRQGRDVVLVVPNCEREDGPRNETASFARTRGSRRVINTVFAGVKR